MNANNYPEILDSQLEANRFSDEPIHEYPNSEYFPGTILDMPENYLRDHDQVVATYSKLVTRLYPHLRFEDYRGMIMEYARELELARNAPNRMYDIEELDPMTLNIMARCAAIEIVIAGGGTLYLQAVHLTLLRYARGKLGPKETAHDIYNRKFYQLRVSLATWYIQTEYPDEETP